MCSIKGHMWISHDEKTKAANHHSIFSIHAILPFLSLSRNNETRKECHMHGETKKHLTEMVN